MTEPWKLCGALRILRVDGRRIWAGRGLELLEGAVDDTGALSWKSVARTPGGSLSRAAARGRLSARALRTGFHSLAQLENGAQVGLVRGALLHRSATESRFRVVHMIERGTRPLALAHAPWGGLYYGEYFGNRAREGVRVWGSEDGFDWQVVWTFRPGQVRHVHAVVADPFRSGMWVLTGDDGDEAGVWWTDDGFQTLEPVRRGDQSARAVGAIPTESGVILPMDAPDEPCFIQHLDPASGRVERLAEISGSAFEAGRSGSLMLIATAVEPSSYHAEQCAALYASRDGMDWAPVASFERDLAWLPRLRDRLGYPTLHLPCGESELPYVFASARGLAQLDGQLLMAPEHELLDELSPVRVA